MRYRITAITNDGIRYEVAGYWDDLRLAELTLAGYNAIYTNPRIECRDEEWRPVEP